MIEYWWAIWKAKGTDEIEIVKIKSEGIEGRVKSYLAFGNIGFFPFRDEDWQLISKVELPLKDASIPNITNSSEPTGDKGEVVGEGGKIKKS